MAKFLIQIPCWKGKWNSFEFECVIYKPFSLKRGLSNRLCLDRSCWTSSGILLVYYLHSARQQPRWFWWGFFFFFTKKFMFLLAVKVRKIKPNKKRKAESKRNIYRKKRAVSVNDYWNDVIVSPSCDVVIINAFDRIDNNFLYPHESNAIWWCDLTQQTAITSYPFP